MSVDAIVPGPADYAQERRLLVNHLRVEVVMHDVIRRTVQTEKQVIGILLGDLTSTTDWLRLNQM